MVIRQLRSNIADVMQDDFIRTAQAKGLRRQAIVVKHALLAAAPATVSILGVQVARLLGGVVVVETVFGISGLGFLTVTAIQQRDLPMIQGIIPLLVLVAIVANVLADLLNSLLDPDSGPGWSLPDELATSTVPGRVRPSSSAGGCALS